MPKYWLVGAKWNGVDKAYDFFAGGYWMLGKNWNDPQSKRARKMMPGDRIAIKGPKIRYIGIIKDRILDINQVAYTVHWIQLTPARIFGSSKFRQSVYGPYRKKQKQWFDMGGRQLQSFDNVFCL